jgi:metal-responsive CopG/Arc/MetJ family transcriptional regulator
LTEASVLAGSIEDMRARKSKRMANITATLPVQLLDKIDEMVDEDKAPSRSFVIREAVMKYLREIERK